MVDLLTPKLRERCGVLGEGAVDEDRNRHGEQREPGVAPFLDFVRAGFHDAESGGWNGRSGLSNPALDGGFQFRIASPEAQSMRDVHVEWPDEDHVHPRHADDVHQVG